MKANGKVIKYGDNIDTDVIIPARYLNTTDHKELASHCMEDIDKEFVNKVKDGDIMVGGANFGCGSSREHAPWALEVNDINSVFAINFARIFRQNMYNCGMLAAELDKAVIDEIFKTFAGKDTEALIDVKASTLELKSGSTVKTYNFKLEGFDRALVESDGWVGYADKKY